VAFGAILKRHGQPAPVDIPGKRAQIFDDIRFRADYAGLDRVVIARRTNLI
jgi:hypothetical protein